MDPVLNQVNEKIQTTLLHLQKDLSSIRAGRANPTLIEELPVNVYGTRMKLMEVGTISAPQTNLLTVQVWDATVIKDVQKAIMESNLGLNPAVEGNTIRLAIPPLTEERREEFIKLAHQKAEATKVAIRQIRGDERSSWEKSKDAGEFGEDELERREKLLQIIIDNATAQAEDYTRKKEEELKQI